MIEVVERAGGVHVRVDRFAVGADCPAAAPSVLCVGQQAAAGPDLRAAGEQALRWAEVLPHAVLGAVLGEGVRVVARHQTGRPEDGVPVHVDVRPDDGFGGAEPAESSATARPSRHGRVAVAGRDIQ